MDVASKNGLTDVFVLDHKIVFFAAVDLDRVALEQCVVNAVSAKVDVVVAVVAVDNDDVASMDHDWQPVVVPAMRMRRSTGPRRICRLFDQQRLEGHRSIVGVVGDRRKLCGIAH